MHCIAPLLGDSGGAGQIPEVRAEVTARVYQGVAVIVSVNYYIVRGWRVWFIEESHVALAVIVWAPAIGIEAETRAEVR